MSSELENTLSKYGDLKKGSTDGVQDGCVVLELSAEEFAYILVVFNTRSLHNNTMRVSFEPYECNHSCRNKAKYDNLLDNILSDIRRLKSGNDSDISQ